MHQFRLLGPVELRRTEGSVPLGPPQQRCVFAVLALTPQRSVPIRTLIDRVWGGRLPRDARGALYTNVSRLRTVLASFGANVLWCDGGYLLDLAPDLVDLHRARRLAAEARTLVGATPDGAVSERLESAAARLAEAGALWCGTPLAGLKGDWADQAREALETERLETLIHRFEVELRLGRHTDVLAPLAVEHFAQPHSEPLAGLRMLALYRSGRQADALAVYAQCRQRIAEAFGDEPGTALRRLHEQILRRSPDLDRDAGAPDPGRVAAAPAPGPTTLPAPPAQLPPEVAGFSGRQPQLRQLDLLLPAASGPRPAAVTVVVIEGTAGVGKTALAVHWAHQVRDRFPDGQLYVDLRGHSAGAPMRPIEVLVRFLSALGVPREQLTSDQDEVAASYRSRVADQRLLIVLDNAAGAEQVRPLLPGGAGSTVLVTSRDQLDGLVACDGAHREVLDVLAPGESQALLTALLGTGRVAAEPDQVAELAVRCGHLPLALRIAAANITAGRQNRVSDYLNLLRDRGPLAVLRVSGDERAAVAAAFDLSYTRLPPPTRRLFHLLGLLPVADFTVEVAAALADTSPAEAEHALQVLVASHLLERIAPGRCGFHDLLRSYAAARVIHDESEPDRQAALGRVYDLYLCRSDTAARLLYPSSVPLPCSAREHTTAAAGLTGLDEALAWLDGERANLLACVTHTAAHGPLPVASRLAGSLRHYFVSRAYLADGLTVARGGLAAATTAGDRHGQAAALLNLAALADVESRYDEAIQYAERSLRVSQEVGWVDGQGAACRAMGVGCWQLGRLAEAVDNHRQALVHFQRSGWRHGQAAASNSLGVVHLDRGELLSAARYTTQALTLNQTIGSVHGEAINLATLGEIYRYLGDFDRAQEHFADAEARFEATGDRYGVGNSLRGLAAVHRDRGHPEQALRLAGGAIDIYRETGHRRLGPDALVTMATIQALTDQPAALTSYRQALALARAGGNRYLVTVALIGLALTRYRGAVEQAHRHLTHALTIASRRGYRLLEGQALTARAALHLAGGEPEQAITDAERAITIHRSTGHRPGQGHSLRVLARALAAAGRPAAARRHQRWATAALAELGIGEPDRTTVLLSL